MNIKKQLLLSIIFLLTATNYGEDFRNTVRPASLRNSIDRDGQSIIKYEIEFRYKSDNTDSREKVRILFDALNLDSDSTSSFEIAYIAVEKMKSDMTLDDVAELGNMLREFESEWPYSTDEMAYCLGEWYDDYRLAIHKGALFFLLDTAKWFHAQSVPFSDARFYLLNSNDPRSLKKNHLLETAVELQSCPDIGEFQINNPAQIICMARLVEDGLSIDEQKKLLYEFRQIFGENEYIRTYHELAKMYFYQKKRSPNCFSIIPSDSAKFLKDSKNPFVADFVPLALLYNENFLELIEGPIAEIAKAYGQKNTLEFLYNEKELFEKSPDSDMSVKFTHLAHAAPVFVEMGITLDDFAEFLHKAHSSGSRTFLKSVDFLSMQLPLRVKYVPLNDLLNVFFVGKTPTFCYAESSSKAKKDSIINKIENSNEISASLKETAIISIILNINFDKDTDTDYVELINTIDGLGFLSTEEKTRFVKEYFSAYPLHSIDDIYVIQRILALSNISFDEFLEKYFVLDGLSDKIGNSYKYEENIQKLILMQRYGVMVQNLIPNNDQDLNYFFTAMKRNNITDKAEIKELDGLFSRMENMPLDDRIWHIQMLLLLMQKESVIKLNYALKNMNKIEELLTDKEYSKESIRDVTIILSGYPYIENYDYFYNQILEFVYADFTDEELLDAIKFLYGPNVRLYGSFTQHTFKVENRKTKDVLKEYFKLTERTSVTEEDGIISRSLITPAIYNTIAEITGLTKSPELDEIVVRLGSVAKNEEYSPGSLIFFVKSMKDASIDELCEYIESLQELPKLRRNPFDHEKLQSILKSQYAPVDEILFLVIAGISDMENIHYYAKNLGGPKNIIDMIKKQEDPPLQILSSFVYSMSVGEKMTKQDAINMLLPHIPKVYGDLRHCIFPYSTIKLIQNELKCDYQDALKYFIDYWQYDSRLNNNVYCDRLNEILVKVRRTINK